MTVPVPARKPGGPRVVIAGDSWVCGLSDRRESIAGLLPRALGATDTLDLSKISRTVPETALLLDEITAFAPDFALLAIGGADSLVFPARWLQNLIDRFAPPEWAGITGLMPPAYRSRGRRKRLRKRAETIVKTVVKQLMINLFGARRRVPLIAVESAASSLLSRLDALGVSVIVIGCSDMGHLLFPKSCKNVHATNALLERLTREHRGAEYVDPRPFLDRWDDFLDDRVHLTPEGSRKVAEGIVAAARETGRVSATMLTPTDAVG